MIIALAELGFLFSVCKAGWTVFNGKCYKYFSEKKTWGDAQDQCVQNVVR